MDGRSRRLVGGKMDRLRAVDPPETPQIVYGSGETRPLSVAVWDWCRG
jgi:hypothetical protein